MSDLISISRAAQIPALAAVAAANPAYLGSLVSAASDAIRRRCGRDFTLSSYTEYHSGGIYILEPLRLRHFPVAELTRVAAGPRPALLARNIDAVTNQRATIETTTTGLRLVRVASAVLSTTDLLFATYPTVGAMAAAINALGNGWTAIARDGFANFPSADFKPLQGAVGVLACGRDLEIHVETVQPFSACAALEGEPALADGSSGGAGWRLDEETGEVYGRFPRGQLNIRVDYRAGFASVPQAVQEACAQLAQDLYQAGLVNNTLKKATLGPSSVELKSSAGASLLSPKVRLLLAPYVDYAKLMFR